MDPYHDPIALAAQGGSSASGRHASDWGLGSLLLGLTLLLMVPLIILVGVSLRGGDLPSVFVTLLDVVAYGFVALAAVAVLFGLIGLISGFVRNQPVGLATTGLMVSLFALVLWVLMFLALMEARARLQQQRHQPFHDMDMRLR